MIYSFYFQHRGELLLSELIYNFEAISDGILIRPKKFLKEFGEFILFVKKDAETWYEDSEISINFPDTFSEIVAFLTTLFSNYRFTFHKNVLSGNTR